MCVHKALSHDEKTLINLYCEGYTRREMADFFDVSLSRIAEIETAAMRKVGANSKLKMILNAIQLEYILLDNFELVSSKPVFRLSRDEERLLILLFLGYNLPEISVVRNIPLNDVRATVKAINVSWDVDYPIKIVFLAIKYGLIRFVDTLLYFPSLNISTSVFEPPKKAKPKDPFRLWVEETEMSSGLANSLLQFHRENFGVKVTEITRKDFLKNRGTGEKKWDEFERVRAESGSYEFNPN